LKFRVPERVSMRQMYAELRRRCEDGNECQCPQHQTYRSALLLQLVPKVIEEISGTCPEPTFKIDAKDVVIIRQRRSKPKLKRRRS
jgi:hypothetical protein